MRAMERHPCPPHLLFGLIALAVAVAAGWQAQHTVIMRGEDAPSIALLDGVPLPAEEAEVNTRLPVAVMIDNLPNGARPQTGLDHADLVYEMLVEGGITRFMAVYMRRDTDRVEPVRSVRTPFLYIARELDAVIAHVGAAGAAGPADAETQMGQWGVRHLDEEHNPGPFQRDRTRRAPHNTIADTVVVRGHALGLSWFGPSGAESWQFKDGFSAVNRSAGAVGHIAYGFAVQWLPAQRDFFVDWYYDPETNSYLRSMAGRPHVDGRTGQTLAFANVVVQVDSAWVADREGHVLYGSLGEGRAYIFLDGHMVEATWTKPSREERTRYWDAEGREVAFNRGATWISLVPDGSPLRWE